MLALIKFLSKIAPRQFDAVKQKRIDQGTNEATP